MAHEIKPIESYPTLPTIEDEIIQSAAQPLHNGNTTIAWDQLGDEQAPLVRQSLIEADRLRQEHADPGDAHLQGVSLAYRGLAGQVSLERLRRELATESFQKEKVSTIKKLIGLTALLSLFKGNRRKPHLGV